MYLNKETMKEIHLNQCHNHHLNRNHYWFQDLQEEAGRLKDDPFTVERMSRDTLNVARPGEVIFKFQPYPTNAIGPGEAKRPAGAVEANQKP